MPRTSSIHSYRVHRDDRGVTFRSRLEGRWAILFDALGLTWSYEPRTLRLRSGERYTPDFRVGLDEPFTWLEMKPAEPTAAEERRASGAATILGAPVYIVSGAPSPTAIIRAYCGSPTDPVPGAHAWCECPFCGGVGLTRDGLTIGLPCGCNGVEGVDGSRSGRLLRAYRAANAAHLEEFRHVRRLGEVLAV